jgi:ribosomal-protein-alanine N-acetyltransferase
VDYTLRDFQPTDFEELWRIDQECFPPGIAYSKADLTAYVRAQGAFTVVVETTSSRFQTLRQADDTQASSVGAIVGFIVAEANKRGSGHIVTIDVLRDVRRSGIGSNLLIAAEGRLRLANCDHVRLETAVDNAAALRFYERHGYAVTRTIRGYYSNGVDALVLVKEL